MRGPTVMLALCVAGVMLPAIANAAASCAGDGPWVQLQIGAEGWNEAQRATVLSDLQHTLAGQGIAACSGDAHPAAAALAMLNVDLSPEDKAKATVDIEVRDAVTHKRVRRDVDLSRIPTTGARRRSRSRRTSCCAPAGRRSRWTRRARGRRRRKRGRRWSARSGR
jgi:hypothetical protein